MPPTSLARITNCFNSAMSRWMSDASIPLNMYRYTGGRATGGGATGGATRGRGSGRECRDVEPCIETALVSGIYDN